MSFPSTLFGLHGGLLVGLIVGLTNFLTILSVMRALSPKDALAARARDHARRRTELRTARLSLRRGDRRQSMGMARAVVARLKLDRTDESKSLADQLAQAGWRSKDTVTIFLMARLASPLVVGALAWLVGPSLLHRDGQMFRLIVTAAGILAGAYLPTLFLKNTIERRRQKIQKALPDALDLFVICAEAGLSLDASVTRVGREIGGSSPEMADELGLTAIELGFLPDRREALQNLARRVGSPDINDLVTTLAQTERYGTPLAQALRVLATEFRDTRMMRAEEKAARLPAIMTIPLILFILPTLFIVILGPASCSINDSFLHG